MPTYDYLCPSCGEEFEEFQSITADPVAKCPKCSKPARRQISAGAGLIFKGSGFYITDYKNKDKGAQSESKAASESGSSGKESKPAADKKTEKKAEPKKKEASPA